MLQEQSGLKRISGISVVAAFGLITMTSNISSQSLATLNTKPAYYYETHNYLLTDNTACNSSTLSQHAVGDIVLPDGKSDFVQQHDKVNVKLQISRIYRHLSNFEFEEEFEEI